MNFNRKNTLLICLVITLVMAYVAWLQHAAMQASVKRGALDVLGNYDRQIESILRIRERHSRELADSLQTDPAFLSLFEQSEQGGLVAVRDGFDAFFSGSLGSLLRIEYRGMQVFRPDHTRLYSLSEACPDDVADNSLAILALVRQTLQPASGYLSGTLRGGRHHAYPVISDGRQLGTVVFGVSSRMLHEEIRRVYGCTCTQILAEETLEPGADPDAYIRLDHLPGYAMERAFYDQVRQETVFEAVDRFALANERKLMTGMDRQEDFVIVDRAQGSWHGLLFLSFTDALGRHAGYRVFFEPLPTAEFVFDVFIENVVLLTLLWMLVILSLLAIWRSREELEWWNGRDYLTEVANRSVLQRLFRVEAQRIARYGGTLSMVMFDIDDFKHINDNFGHLSGDEILKEISRLVQDSIRATDTLVRWGGDEFIVFMPGTTRDQAAQAAEKIKRTIRDHVPGVRDLDAVRVTCGTSEYGDGDTLDSFVQRADQELYHNKKKKKGSGGENAEPPGLHLT